MAKDDTDFLEAMASPAGSADGGPRGIIVEGFFKGVKDPEPWTSRDGSRSGMTRPKLGLEDEDGNTFALVCSAETLERMRRSPKGEVVRVPISIQPPFGSSGPVRLVVRGDEGRGGDDGWQ